MWTYKCDRCGAALDPGERCDCQDRPAKYNGKPIFTQENFNYRNANKLQDIYDMWRSEALICIVKTKKGAAKK